MRAISVEIDKALNLAFNINSKLKGKHMKKIIVATALLSLSATAAFATSIVNSKHNLSSSQTLTLRSTTQNQICVFCHTPHNALQNIPLWNRTNKGSSFKMYTSNTLTAAAAGAKLDSKSISLFCLSCHDGAAGTIQEVIGDQVNNKGGNAFTMQGTWTNGDLTSDGKGLSNDHPIGFSYGEAQSGDPTGLISGPAGVSFFKSSTKPDSMECSSCHAVHNNQYSPFLRKSNVGSGLCLTCHSK